MLNGHQIGVIMKKKLFTHIFLSGSKLMVNYRIEDITEGMTIGESVFTKSGQLLVSAGYNLNNKQIELLKKMGFKTLMVDIEGTEEVNPQPVISTQVQSELTTTVEQSSKDIRSVFGKELNVKSKVIETIEKDRNNINDIIRNSGLVTMVSKIIDDICTEPWALVNITKIINESDDLFKHSIFTTIISLCIGYKYTFSFDELKQLGLGAINYDIGMLSIPTSILNKESPLNEEEQQILNQHTIYGYMMLSGISAIPPTSTAVALSHHEHQDGSGYPRGLKGENRPPAKSLSKGTIHRFAEIVAVADAYEMYLNGRRHFSEALGSKGAIAQIIKESGSKFNTDIVKTLIKIVPIYPVGTRVKITDAPFDKLIGCTGVISSVSPEHITKPQVLIYENKNKTKMKPVTLDMQKVKGITLELLT
ncbi:HD domain-containing phosphohydrolase [Chitinispirillales bacterium ANBcel5]|uniref:HD-GYP domain-containing protein n=1 Tax=Cellulosispirillum alkaliphilum TaxID=3039283 RepID=UPI002A553452|nr:HD domain-containing phosphohydrolase [Chitinispirillales bacterium ANBcel5]